MIHHRRDQRTAGSRRDRGNYSHASKHGVTHEQRRQLLRQQPSRMTILPTGRKT